jgi:photosystem II stability/assembly factor-like uncharacterized protein
MKKSLLLFSFLSVFSSHAQWVLKGPYGGDVTSFAFMNNNIFATSASGIFKSIDKGANWVEANNGLPIATINKLEVKGSVVFAATTKGVYKSIDSGANWIQLPIAPKVGYIKTIVFNENTLFAGCVTELVNGDTGGVYVSSNNGNTWKKENYNLPIQYISVNNIAIVNQHIIISTNSGARVYTKKMGDTLWTNAKIIENVTVTKFNILGRSIFASTTNMGEFVSYNYGQKWTKVNPPTSSDTSFVVMMTNSSMVYAMGKQGFYSSADTGNKWIKISDNSTLLFKSTKVYTITAYSNYWLAATSSGILLSTDKGKTWAESNKGLVSISAKSIAYNGNTLFAAAGVKLLATPDDGKTWIDGQSKRTVFSNCVMVDKDTVWAGNWDGLYSTIDNGKNWSLLNNTLKNKDIRTMAAFGNKIYAGTTIGAYTSGDAGKTWQQVNGGLISKDVGTLVVNDSCVLAGTSQTGLYRLNSKGTGWIVVAGGLKGKIISALAAKNNKIFVASDSGVYFSENNGNTWSKTKEGITSLRTLSLLMYDTTVFAGTYDGVFMLNNHSKTWVPINASLPKQIAVSNIIIAENNIFIATNKGVWSRPLADIGLSIKNEKTSFNSIKIYPNPVNNYLYFSAERCNIFQALIFDSTGKLMMLHNLEENQISLENLSSGIYFIKLTDTNGKIYASKLLKK